MLKLLTGIGISFVIVTGAVQAHEDIPDLYPQSALYAKPVEVIPDVFSAIGATAPPTYENTGHNNNLSFIITGEGVVVVNAGAAYILAKALHEEIKTITDQPVRLVINENGQGHAMLGNNYWAEQGVPILAHEDAAHEFEERGYNTLENMKRYNRDKSEGTVLQGPTETFSETYVVPFGDFPVEAVRLGPAHGAGDISVWLPEQQLVIAGDIAFHERMLPIFADTDTAAWVETWKNAFEPLGANFVIPGHGHPTNMAQVTRYTHDYLVYLRGKIGEHLDSGGDLKDAYYVDQSPYEHLDTYEELATKNAGRVYEAMEFE
jgi:glyoxylase-like metal-dependent hydrolase (beta-lactamase superfamily II)